MSKPMLRLAYDADNAGRQVGRAIIANDENQLHNISAKIDLGHELVNEWVADHGGKRISGGGDEGSFKIPFDSAKKVEELRKKYFNATGFTISVGIGKNLSECGLSLICAKFKGKNQTVWYGPKVERAIKESKEKIKTGKASSEEIKLAEAYLEKSESMICNLHKKEQHKKHIHKIHQHAMHKNDEGFHDENRHEEMNDDCPMCIENEDNSTDDCQLCADLDAQENADGTAGMDDCEMCKDYDAADQETGAIDDCPYCEAQTIEEADGGTEADKNLNHYCNCPDCPCYDQTGLAVEDMGAEHPDNCPECQALYSDAIENQPEQTGQTDPNLQGHETAENVLDLLDQEPGTGEQTPEKEASKIDNTELPQGDAMKENVSVKENFGDSQKNDISDSESEMAQGHDCNCPNCDKSAPADNGDPTDEGSDEPDMAGVLQSGLEDHANEQKKQQVLDMVGQTLAGFKSNKSSLEATKEQNQPLYNSCIQMLKSMIELCKLLGLQPKMPDQNMQSEKPSAPEKQAAPSEGAAQGPKTQAG